MASVTGKLKGYAWFAWVVLVIAVAIGFSKLEGLNHSNQERINDIQQSRVESCETTYRSFHAVFDPFFPPPGKRTAGQVKQFHKFDRIIAKKIAECQKQTKPHMKKQGGTWHFLTRLF